MTTQAVATTGLRSTTDDLGGRRANPLVYAVLIIIGIAFIIPLLWLISIGLKDQAGLTDGSIIPKPFVWSNFKDAVTLIPFRQYATVSILLATVNSVLSVLSSAFVGFGFARLQAKGKKVYFMVVIATMMVPGIVTLIPTYLLFAKFGLVYTYWPWVLWGLSGSAFLIFLFRQAFASLPSELEDAAIMDGCSYFRMFWSVFLPLSKAVCVAGFILSFTGVWADFIAPTLFLTADQTTLAVGLSQGYKTPAGDPLDNVMAAGAFIYILPILVIFLVLQRGFVNGFATSGMK